MQRKKGISLIVLVITIIVMIILAAAIILSLNNAGIIGNANQAVFKQNVKNYLSELDLYYMDALIDNSYANTKNIKATATTNPSITDLIPSMSEEDKTKFRVAGGNLIYIGANRSEYEWCRELDIMIDSTNLSEEQYNALYAEEIAYIQTISRYNIDEFSSNWSGLVLTENTDKEVLVIPYGTEQIGLWGFSGRIQAKEIILPNTMKEIGDGAFDGCNKIEYLILPNDITTINESAFWGCKSMKYLELSRNLKTIGTQAFQDCTGLEEVIFPQGIKIIYNSAFQNCTGLIEVTIPASVTSTYAIFPRCSNLKRINIEEGNTVMCNVDGVIYNKDKTTLISVPPTKLGEFIVPNTVTKIGGSAFGGCNKLTSIKLPDSLTRIGTNAFSYCTGLKTLTIPKNVTQLEGDLFNNSNSVKSLYIDSTAISRASMIGYSAFDGLAEGSTIYVRNATIASYLTSNNYELTKTTISTDYNW